VAEENDRYPRWQKIAIDQFGYALNLTLTFTIATLGYCFALMKDNGFVPVSSAKCAMTLSLLALALSAVSGFTCVVNRLWDFKGTAKRARNDARAPSDDALDKMGKRTWILFYVQLGTFVTGLVALAVTLLLTYGYKLI